MDLTGHATDYLVDATFPEAMSRFVDHGRRRWPDAHVNGRPLPPQPARPWHLPEPEGDGYPDIVTFSSGQEMEDFWEENGYALDAAGEGPYAVFHRLHPTVQDGSPQAKEETALPPAGYYTVSLVTPDDPSTDPFSQTVVTDFEASLGDAGTRLRTR
ncbi:hypothetical protein [Streptomyces sp. NPDC087294]|uniref:hypothetical protein n=1 Tax=Streptomyces sp. NPDC087294 TaxID=3365777 RepID=UPI0038082DE9